MSSFSRCPTRSRPSYPISELPGTDAPFLVLTVAWLSQRKVAAESRQQEPDLRKLVGCALTLRHTANWVWDEDEAFELDRVKDEEKDGFGNEPEVEHTEIAMVHHGLPALTEQEGMEASERGFYEELDVEIGSIENISLEDRGIDAEQQETLVWEEEVEPERA